MKVDPRSAARPSANVNNSAAGEPAATTAARKNLTEKATHAVGQVVAAHAAAGTTPVGNKHPLLEGFGNALGLSLGVLVTEALAAVPSWNTPVLGADGKPVHDVPGATRVGNHDILRRHQEVVGPKIADLVAKMPAGAVHDLLDGLAKGATAAPGTSYRIESAIMDHFERR